MDIDMKKTRKADKKRGGKISRRDFMAGAAAAAAFTIVPRHVLGGTGYTPPSEKLNIAAIGVGGLGDMHSRGTDNLLAVEGENIVALCDVDHDYSAEMFKRYPNAKIYTDYRKMLEKQKDIDAVIVSTPDHSHAAITMMALKMGKHVYCEKPLTHSIYEARKITEAAGEAKVATQMGNQGHAEEGIRLICEWIWDGAIGPVREVHAWANRPAGWWPQGIKRPTDKPPVPAGLNWDLWLGPAPYRPYHPAYLPFVWRGWWDFGTGVMGDMGCHILDPAFWALKLKAPTSIEACFTKGEDYKEKISETAPKSSIIYYQFPARDGMPPVKLTWYDGGLMPERPQELEEGRRMGGESGGTLFVGEKAKIMCGCYGRSPD